MKTLYKFVAILFYLVLSYTGYGQNQIFLKKGRIEYERRTNTYALMSEISKDGAITQESVEMYKKNNPQFKTDLFSLLFNEQASLYKPAIENENTDATKSIDEWFSMVSHANVIYTDLVKKQRVSQKKVFGNLFLIADSVRKIHWKLTDEIREIAGFKCKRANAIIMDTTYVIAFFTNEILVPGGPETLSGLPGMILGLAVPELHMSWFAKRIYLEPIDNQLIPPSQGKKLAGQEFGTTMNETIKGWGSAGLKIFKKAVF